MTSPLHIALLLNTAALAALLGQWLDGNLQPKWPVWTPPAAVAPALGDGIKPVPPPKSTPDAYVQALDRPLFSPDRRSAPAPDPTSVATADDWGETTLVGLVSGPQGIAILRSVDGVTRLRVGQTRGAWTLQSVTHGTAVFASGEQSKSLSLTYQPLGAVTARADATKAVGTASTPRAPTAASASPQAQEESERERRVAAMRAKIQQQSATKQPTSKP